MLILRGFLPKVAMLEPFAAFKDKGEGGGMNEGGITDTWAPVSIKNYRLLLLSM